MSKRPHISVRDKVDVAIAQARGGYIICPLCGNGLLPKGPRILEHMVVRAFTNSDDPEYLAWVHADCAHKKTNGNKATCADGDIHKIAKAKRIAKKNETELVCVSGHDLCYLGPDENCQYCERRPVKKRKGRKMPSRPFPKRMEART